MFVGGGNLAQCFGEKLVFSKKCTFHVAGGNSGKGKKLGHVSAIGRCVLRCTMFISGEAEKYFSSIKGTDKDVRGSEFAPLPVRAGSEVADPFLPGEQVGLATEAMSLFSDENVVDNLEYGNEGYDCGDYV